MNTLGWTVTISVAVLSSVFVAGVVKNFALDDGRDTGVSSTATSREMIGEPRAVVEQNEFDFGVIEPESGGEHVFVIRNEGDAPLQLRNAGKTCKCVGVEISSRVVPPGEAATVRLQYEARFVAEEYRHGASIATNDPENEFIKFRVNGRVKTVIAAEPNCALFERVLPGESDLRRFVVYSQDWDSFAVQEVKASLESLQVELEPASTSQLAKLRAKSGYSVIVKIPNNLPVGVFHEWIQLDISRTDGEEESRTVNVDVQGNVIRRLSVRGDERLKDYGTIYFGVLRPEAGAKSRLILQVRDEIKDIQLERIVATPDYIDATLTPFQQRGMTKEGMYYLDIEIPPGEWIGNHIGKDAAKVTLEIGHPRIDDLELDVEFAILQADR